VDLSITDANNMGAAMAPAAFDTIRQHMLDLGTHAEDYDLIVTGDLGQLGKELLLILAQKADLPIAGKLMDCGTTVFDVLGQDVHAGGSGCGCSAVTLCGYLLEQLKSHNLKKILFCGTGALLSPTSCQQGLPIPGICHAVSIEGA
jgi:stage V sporulation protein AD